MQELRVTQTGVQILFTFLPTLVFQQRFTELDRFAVIVYVVTVVFCVAASIFLIAPVALHRAMFRLGRKSEVVDGSAKQARPAWRCWRLLSSVLQNIARVGRGTAPLAGAGNRRRDRVDVADGVVRRTRSSRPPAGETGPDRALLSAPDARHVH